MPTIQAMLILLLALGVAACDRSPSGQPADAGATSAGSPEETTFPFVASIDFEPVAELPEDASLKVYLLETDLETGDRRLVAETSLPASAAPPVTARIDLPWEDLNVAMAYEMFAAMLDGSGRVLMTTVSNRMPMPAMGLSRESVHRLRLLPVASPAPPEEVFRLPGELQLDCAGIGATVRQQDDGSVQVDLAERSLELSPAVASAGGRFSDGRNEFWITDELQAFLLLAGEPSRGCVPEL